RSQKAEGRREKGSAALSSAFCILSPVFFLLSFFRTCDTLRANSTERGGRRRVWMPSPGADHERPDTISPRGTDAKLTPASVVPFPFFPCQPECELAARAAAVVCARLALVRGRGGRSPLLGRLRIAAGARDDQAQARVRL